MSDYAANDTTRFQSPSLIYISLLIIHLHISEAYYLKRNILMVTLSTNLAIS